ncbi:hypothetical protein BGHDH14_bgh02193 [Blumeria hordei DH14]|uniref:Uncharacterized protein n=1 Tax=Blumeria graminis f. sp. hordei (strain DH14) TaxID=546991 RepID=N1JHI5_BLUG1|nr:hypothetical protein BGHDH14_bgh02193 [Blumeria hordei DH14]
MPDTKHTCQYSQKELLDLRDSLPIVRCNVASIKMGTDIAKIFRLPEKALETPENFTCRSKDLAEFSSQFKKRTIGRVLSEISEDNGNDCDSMLLSRSPTQPQFHWALRQEEGKHRLEKPYPAPADIAAQKAENFQKFYRAVVSPTHVRVTAGGRIVPNIKPVEATGFDGDGNNFKSERSVAEACPAVVQPPWSPYLNSLQASSYPTLTPTGSTQFLNASSSNVAYDATPVASQIYGNTSSVRNTASNLQYPKLGCNIADGIQPTITPSEIKISHPSQFDQTKPFTINGQLVYPVSPEFQPPAQIFPVPVRIPSNLTTPQNQIQIFNENQSLGSFGNMTNPLGFPESQHLVMGGNSSGNLYVPSSLIPTPYTTVPALEFLTNQLQSLFANLQALENQIATNNSPHEKKVLETQRHVMQIQINSINNMLAIQFSSDEVDRGKSTGDKRLHLQEIQADLNEADKGFKKFEKPDKHSEIYSTFKQANIISNINHANKPDDSEYLAKLPNKSRLSKSSAKAQPFQPRHPKNVTIQSKMPENFPVCGKNSEKCFPTKIEHENYAYFKNYTPMGEHHNFQGASSFYELPRSRSLGAPYLIGTIPSVSKCNSSIPPDAVYSRPLTREEIQARHVYFGEAPRLSASGLPKFDGKDFYPPSPLKKEVHLNSKKSEFGGLDKGPFIAPNSRESLLTSGAKENSNPLLTRSFCSTQNIQHDKQSFCSCSIHSHDNGILEKNTNGAQADQLLPPPKIINNDEIQEEDFANLFVKDNFSRLNSQSPPRSKGDATFEEDFSNIFTENVALSSLEHQNYLCDKSKVIAYESKIEPSGGANRGRSPTENYGERKESFSHLPPEIKSTPSLTKEPAKIVKSPSRIRTTNSIPVEKSILQRIENFPWGGPPLVPLVGPVLSGAITSANAQGYLPQFCEFSDVPPSTPTVAKLPDVKAATLQKNPGKICSIMPLNISNSNSENNLIKENQKRQPVTSASSFGAENYMRYLTQRGS